MTPTLPQNDPDVAGRRTDLDKAREEYIFDRSTSDLLFAKEVPKRDWGGIEYWAKLAKVNLEVALNKARMSGGLLTTLTAKLAYMASDMSAENFSDSRKALHEAAGSIDKEYPARSISAYEEQYPHLPKPRALENWEDDQFFAWIALGGSNPNLITRLHAAGLKMFEVDDAAYQKIVGSNDTLKKALTQGRLFVGDYSTLDGRTAGSVDEYSKVVTAPRALYAALGDQWFIVGIQAGADPGASRFVQPGDGVSWKMAKVALLAADSQLTGLVAHFGLCHCVMEAVVLSTRRNLADSHPLRLLLDAHTENTLIVNEITRSSLTPPDGAIDRMMAQDLQGSLDMTAQAVRDFRIMESAPPQDFARRGVDDVRALPSYPYRDDQTLLWNAIETWVTAYIGIYYRDDSDVCLDEELQAFVVELGHENLGGLAGIGKVETVERLTALISRLVFRGTAFHAAINYALYDFGFAPLQPQAAFADGPADEGGPSVRPEDTELDYRKMLPPLDIAYEVIEAFYPLGVRINTLGDYGRRYFKDDRVDTPLAAFQTCLN
jgi:arachidonate 15-lipoxygenase